MSELLNDSPTAVKHRERVLSELAPTEQILYVAEGQVFEPLGANNFNLFIGAIVVTSQRLLIFESKMLGRVALYQVAWRDVQKDGRSRDGKVALQKGGPRPIWEISIWEGKSHRSPLDTKRLDMLSLSINEARTAIAAERGAEAVDAYEELKRRRGF